MRLRVLSAFLVLTAAAGCTPEWARQGNADVVLVMDTAAASGGAAGGGGTVLLSDVLTKGSVVNDNAALTVRSFTKNVNSPPDRKSVV